MYFSNENVMHWVLYSLFFFFSFRFHSAMGFLGWCCLYVHQVASAFAQHSITFIYTVSKVLDEMVTRYNCADQYNPTLEFFFISKIKIILGFFIDCGWPFISPFILSLIFSFHFNRMLIFAAIIVFIGCGARAYCVWDRLSDGEIGWICGLQMRKIGFEYFSMKIAFTLLSSPPEYLFQPLILCDQACMLIACYRYIHKQTHSNGPPLLMVMLIDSHGQ